MVGWPGLSRFLRRSGISNASAGYCGSYGESFLVAQRGAQLRDVSREAAQE